MNGFMFALILQFASNTAPLMVGHFHREADCQHEGAALMTVHQVRDFVCIPVEQP